MMRTGTSAVALSEYATMRKPRGTEVPERCERKSLEDVRYEMIKGETLD
jgi:hypothetical protein